MSHTRLDEGSSLKPLVDRIGETAGSIERLLTFTGDYQSIGIKAPQWHDVHYNIGVTKSYLNKAGLTISDNVGSLQLYADPLIHKVLYNLVDNAIRHGKTVKNIHFSYYRNNTGIVLVCEDDGAGIPDAEKKKIFGNGYGKHTGLGLFFIQEVLSITGMSMQETGTYGKGARFEILVPEGFYRFNEGQDILGADGRFQAV